ncbi:MAG: transaldolase family protein [Candidatus Latescibacter sp.]|nr:transaldolase family protein [Candidatus Latescibacter sp.]
MRLYLDTANLEEIKEAVSWNIIDGVTTNPSLIKKAILKLRESDIKVDIESYIKKILAAVGRMCPVSLEVADLTADEMIEQGMLLFEKFNQVAGNVVIKIPVCTVNSEGKGQLFDGLVAIQALSDEKIPVNATLIFTPEQAFLAAKAGADYVSPFVGRVDDRIRGKAGIHFEKTDYFPAAGMHNTSGPENVITDQGLVSGVDLVARIVDIFDQYEIPCEIIAASIRNSIQVREVAETGADIVSMPFDILKSMITHPGTAAGIDGFTSDLVDEYMALFSPRKEGEVR